MFETLRNAFRVKDIRDRIIFTFLMLILIRLGSQLPLPGVDGAAFYEQVFKNTNLGFFEAITGGSFEQMSVFALSITPYITSSIIMQLLTIAIPALEEMHREPDGKKKIAEITRYVTIGLALFEASAMTYSFYNTNGIMADKSILSILSVVFALTAGSAVLMWIGERITEKGIGNGISIVLVINIVSRIPLDMKGLWDKFIVGPNNIVKAVVAAIVILAIILGMVVFVILLQGAERRIPVQYSKRIQGRKQVGGQQTHIPLKVNTSGVIPVIFAQSLLQTPVILSSFISIPSEAAIAKMEGFKHIWWLVVSEGLKYLNQGNWCKFTSLSDAKYTIGLLVYIALIIGFAYFYTQISFNPLEIANNMKKAGGFVPGLRPGKVTSDYIAQVLNYIVLIGAVFLTVIAIVPIFFAGVFNASVSFAGTSIIIVVGVIIETLKQIESQMRVRYYKGFLDD